MAEPDPHQRDFETYEQWAHWHREKWSQFTFESWVRQNPALADSHRDQRGFLDMEALRELVDAERSADLELGRALMNRSVANAEEEIRAELDRAEAARSERQSNTDAAEREAEHQWAIEQARQLSERVERRQEEERFVGRAALALAVALIVAAIWWSQQPAGPPLDVDCSDEGGRVVCT